MMKLIWYLPTWGQKLIVEELQPFLFGKFNLGHPVLDFLTLVTLRTILNVAYVHLLIEKNNVSYLMLVKVD